MLKRKLIKNNPSSTDNNLNYRSEGYSAIHLEFIFVLYSGFPEYLCNIITLYKQGEVCDDCNCEYCDDCLSNRCMCDIQSYDQLVNYIIEYLYFNFSYIDIVKFVKSLTTIYDRRFYDENRHKAYLYIIKINLEYFNTYYLQNPKKLTRKKKQ